MDEEGQNSSHDSENHSASGDMFQGSEDSSGPMPPGQPDQKTQDWVKLNMETGLIGFDPEDLEECAPWNLLKQTLTVLFDNINLSVAQPYIRPFKQVFTKIGLFGKVYGDFDLKASLKELYPDNKSEGGPCRAVVNEDRYVYRCLDCRKNESALM